MNPTFTYVEDYIEFIGGHRDVTGRHLGIFQSTPSPINLARYDVQIIESFCNQVLFEHKPYTDKQAELAVRIVTKYRKQLLQLATPVFLPESLNQFRMGIRTIDRTKSVTIDQGQFLFKFPYDTKLIDLTKKQIKEGYGAAEFDGDIKAWRLALTESMLNWIMAIAPANGFTISPEVLELYDAMLAVEQQSYKIELQVQNGEFVITNAEDSLIEYINQHLGGFGLDNVLTLVDNSQVLGYSLSPEISAELSAVYGPMWKLISNRHSTFKKEELSWDQAMAYAKLVNRLPVYVYESGIPKADTEDIVYLNHKTPIDLKPKLLISNSSIMLGSKKETWRNNAEKIIIIE
jgi:hypothetical protein